MITRSATPLLAEKRVAHLHDFPLACGRDLERVTIGYETYGRLNADRSNAILVCHFFSGTSHAAGVYHPEDALPGWWDPVIGPGKAIDTDRDFVIAMDALGCVRKDHPHGLTTGPATVDPVSGQPYGPDFPPLVVSDTVRAHRQVLRQLGITRLKAIVGPSYGAMQALEWATRFPDEVEAVVAAIGLEGFQAREIGLYHLMEQAIRRDPAFRNGRYSADTPPSEGLGLAIGLMLWSSSGRAQMVDTFGRRSAAPGRNPAKEPTARWAIEEWLSQEMGVRAGFVDANAWIAMLRTCMAWDLAEGFGSLERAVSAIQARVLLLPALGDELVDMAHHHDRLVATFHATGKTVEVAPLPERFGHLAGLVDIGLASDALRTFLNEE
jgi:homoserine O-acetyltransferase